MGRLPAALALAVALLALVPGGNAQYATPYQFIAAQPDMTLLKACIDNLLPKNKAPWTAPKSSDYTIFLPTDEGFRQIFSFLNMGMTADRFCTFTKQTKLNTTRNAVMKYHVLDGARTRAQLPGNCPGGCQYSTIAGGKNLQDVLTVDIEPSVKGLTYVIGGNNDDYADFQFLADGTPRYDISVNGRMLHVIDAAMIQGRYIPPKGSPPPPPSPPPRSPPPRVSPPPTVTSSPSPPPPSPPPPSPPPPPPPSPPPPSPPPMPLPPTPPPPSPPPPSPPPPSPPPPSPPPPNPPPPSPPPPNPPPPSPPPPPVASPPPPPPSPPPPPPPPSPRPPPSPYAGFDHLYDFISKRIADLTRLKIAVDAAGLATTLSNPNLVWSCFFPNDAAFEWTRSSLWIGGLRTLIGQANYVLSCSQAGAAADATCKAAANQFTANMANRLLQHCVDRSDKPYLLTIDAWTNNSFPTVQPGNTLFTRLTGSQYWVSLNSTNVTTTLLADTAFTRNRDNYVAKSSVQIISDFMPNVVSAPAPPPPPSLPPPSPTPPPPVFATIPSALVGINQLSVTRQLISLLNLTTQISALTGTTCFFPSNAAWVLFGTNSNDLGAFVNVVNNATTRRRLSDTSTFLTFEVADGVIATTAISSRRRLAEVANMFNSSAFIDSLAWNVTLEAPSNAITVSLLRLSILNSCYNPPNAPGSANAGLDAVAKLANTVSTNVFQTAIGWQDTTGVSVAAYPMAGSVCSDNAVVNGIQNVPLETLGYCSQCPVKDNVTNTYPNCNITAYVLLTAGRSGFENGTITNVNYTRGRAPFVYWVPRDIVVGTYATPTAYVEIVDRIVQPPMMPPPPPSPLPPRPPPAPVPPPPAFNLFSFISTSPEFQGCAYRLFNATNFFAEVSKFDLSGWTLFLPTDAACNATLLARGRTVDSVIADGTASSIVKNMFYPSRALRIIDLNSPLPTYQGIIYSNSSSANSMLNFLVNLTVGNITVTQTFPGFPMQVARIFRGDLVIYRQPSGIAGYIHVTNNLLFPDLTFPSPPPSPLPPFPPPSPPAPPPPPPPPAFTTGLMAYLGSYPELSILKSIVECLNQTATLEAALNASGATILAPTNSAWSAYFGSTGLSVAALCAPASLNTTMSVLQAHFVKNTFFYSDILASTVTRPNYDYLSPTYAPFKIVLRASNTSANATVPMPPTTAFFVANRYDSLLFTETRPSSASAAGAAVAHMVTSVLPIPQTPPPPPPPPPPPNSYNATNAYEGVQKEPLIATFSVLAAQIKMNPTTTFAAYLSNPSTIATILAPTVDALFNFFKQVTIDGAPMTFSDCLDPSKVKALEVCKAVLNFAILPNATFLPSYDSASYVVPVSGESLPYAVLGSSTLATSGTRQIYRLDLSTSPPLISSLWFRTSPFCSGVAKTLKGPVPVGIPNILTQKQSMLYVIDTVLINQEIFTNGVTFTPPAVCAPP